MSEKRHWTVCKECGNKRNQLHGKEVRDILAAFFFDTKFKTKNDWSIENPDSPKIFLPTFNLKTPSGTYVNKNLLSNKNLFLRAAQNKKETPKKKYCEIFFSCFAHPLIYLEYERFILLTKYNSRHSQMIKLKKRPKGTIENKVLNISYKGIFKAFCKTRTKFLKCHGETIKPAFFCEGAFSKLYGPKNKIIKLIKKLGYPTIINDLKNFEGNKGINSSLHSKKTYQKKNEETIEEQLKNVEANAATLKYLKKTEEKENKEEPEEEETKEVEETVDLNEALKGHITSEEEKENSFGKTRPNYAVSHVLGLWNKGRKKDAITLFKMFKDTSKTKENYNNLINTMISSRHFF